MNADISDTTDSEGIASLSVGQSNSTPPVRYVFRGPVRVRKHSSGDLHSRLKTRKLLGVGETDDGDVHRSKLSQILGHSEQLFVRLPRGLRIWQLLTAIMFSTIGAWAIIFPAHLFSFALDGAADASAILPIRLYGGALISLSVVFWSTLQSVDKDVIRWSLLGSAAYFVIQVVVTATWLYDQGKLLQLGPRLLSYRVFVAIGSAGYYWYVGDNNFKIRRCNSSTDINSRNTRKVD